MEPYINKECQLRAQVHEHGSEVCGFQKCYICIDGYWADKEQLIRELTRL